MAHRMAKAAMVEQQEACHLVPSVDPESQQEEHIAEMSALSHRGGLGKACAIAVGIALAIAGSTHLARAQLFGRGLDGAEQVRNVVGESLVTHLKSAKCHWIKMEQHDFPERSDAGSVIFTNFKSLADVERYAEKEGYVGFALRDNIAYLKGGANAPRSWQDLLWMGDSFAVDFYLCENKDNWKQTAEEVRQALAAINGYVEKNTAAVREDWVTVYGKVPDNEGFGMNFPNEKEVKTVEDEKILCAAHPDCVGFTHNSKTGMFHAKKKYTGYVAATATYHRKADSYWQWHYIKSRATDRSAQHKPLKNQATPTYPPGLLENYTNVDFSTLAVKK